MINNNTAIYTLLALFISATAQGQIYESKSSDGSTVFTDTPSEGAQEVTLQKENIADAVKPMPREAQEETSSASNASKGHSQVVEIGSQNRQYANDDWEETRGEELLDGEERYEVRDAEKRHEVRNAEERHEVRDAEVRHEVRHAQPRR